MSALQQFLGTDVFDVTESKEMFLTSLSAPPLPQPPCQAVWEACIDGLFESRRVLSPAESACTRGIEKGGRYW